MKRKCDIDGVVGAAFQVARHIGEYDAGNRIALLIEQACDVIVDDFLLKFVDELFLSFGSGQFVEGFVFENIDAFVDGFERSISNLPQFIEGFCREGCLLGTAARRIR